jgi:hypothetical protein
VGIIVVVYSSVDSSPVWWMIESIVLLLMVTLNVINNIWNSHLEMTEIIQIAKQTLKRIQGIFVEIQLYCISLINVFSI